MLGLDFVFNSDAKKFKESPGIKINYSDVYFENVPNIKPVELLFESDILQQQIECFAFKHTKAFFKSSEINTFLFDLFAASFYLLSRYEEYLPFSPDKHGRYSAAHSLAYRENFLEQPVIELWLEEFKNYLHQFYPEIIFKRNRFQFICTIDVDNGYAYIGKSLLKTYGGMAKALLKGNIKEFIRRIKVISGTEKDPFDCYSFQNKIAEDYHLKMIYFMLCGEQGPNDHNIPVDSNEFYDLLNYLKTFAEIGLHPSYDSYLNIGCIVKEKKGLEKIIGQPIVKSRQHFLKMSLPDSYNNLISAEIKEDYSMGYVSHPGFRAGISRSFPWYDLKAEKERDLLIYPFQIMEVTFKDYLQIHPNEALYQIKEIINTVKSINGVIISIWHDRSFAQIDKNAGWNEVYLEMIKELKKE